MNIVIVFFQSKLGIAFISSVVTAIVGIIVFKRKLKIKQKMEFEKVIGEKIANALMEAWKISKKAKEIENYELVRCDEVKTQKAFTLGIYPSIMNDMDNLMNYYYDVNAFRKRHEEMVSRKVAAHTFFIEKYLMELMSFIAENNIQDSVPELGCGIIYDIQNWQQSFEKCIVKDINKHKVKVVLHRGKKWEKEKERLKTNIYNKSILLMVQKNKEELTEGEAEAMSILRGMTGL